MSCGLPPPLSEMETLAVREPVTVGLKVTLIVQLAFEATLLPQVLVSEKSLGSAPVTVMELTVIIWMLVLVSVTVCGVLVEPTFTSPKFRLVEESCTKVSVPVSGTVCGLFEALSVIVIVPVSVLVFDGVKVTVMLQFAPVATLDPQVLV